MKEIRLNRRKPQDKWIQEFKSVHGEDTYLYLNNVPSTHELFNVTCKTHRRLVDLTC